MATTYLVQSDCVSSAAHTNGNIGPWVDGNNNVYVFASQSTSNTIRMMKASDPNSTSWTAQGTSPSTTNGPVLAMCSRQVGTTIHCAIADFSAGADGNVEYHTFRTSDHASADTWDIAENVATAEQECSVEAAMSLQVRSDGDVIICHSTQVDKVMGTDYFRVMYSRREGGTWTADVLVAESGTEGHFVGAGSVLGASDAVYFFYSDHNNADAEYKKLTSGNTLDSSPTKVGDHSVGNLSTRSISEGVYFDDAGTEKIFVVYQGTGGLRCAPIHNGTVQTTVVASNATSLGNTDESSLALDGTDLYCMCWHNANQDYRVTKSTDKSTSDWASQVELSGIENFNSIASLNIIDHGGGKVLAMCHHQTSNSRHYVEDALAAAPKSDSFIRTGLSLNMRGNHIRR